MEWKRFGPLSTNIPNIVKKVLEAFFLQMHSYLFPSVRMETKVKYFLGKITPMLQIF